MTDYRLKLSFSQQRAPTVCEAIPSFTQFLHAMFECNVQYLSMTLKKKLSTLVPVCRQFPVLSLHEQTRMLL